MEHMHGDKHVLGVKMLSSCIIVIEYYREYNRAWLTGKRFPYLLTPVTLDRDCFALQIIHQQG